MLVMAVANDNSLRDELLFGGKFMAAVFADIEGALFAVERVRLVAKGEGYIHFLSAPLNCYLSSISSYEIIVVLISIVEILCCL